MIIHNKTLIPKSYGNKEIKAVYKGNKLVWSFIPPTKIALYDKINDIELTVASPNYNITDYPKDRYTPIGIVIISKEHSLVLYPENHPCYGKDIIISLKYMRYDNPDIGGEPQQMYWGGFGYDLSLYNYAVRATVNNEDIIETPVEGTKSTYIPSTRWNKIESKTAPKTYFNSLNGPFGPPPYIYKDNKWQLNSAFYNCPSTCCQYDKDGINNTKIILDNVTVNNWKTSETIENNYSQGNYPAAMCCWRYHIEGIDNQGDWYLPAVGELCYFVPFLNEHEKAISIINKIYSNSYAYFLANDTAQWASGERDNNSAWDVYVIRGYESNNGKDNALYVRAFRPLRTTPKKTFEITQTNDNNGNIVDFKFKVNTNKNIYQVGVAMKHSKTPITEPPIKKNKHAIVSISDDGYYHLNNTWITENVNSRGSVIFPCYIRLYFDTNGNAISESNRVYDTDIYAINKTNNSSVTHTYSLISYELP